MAGLIIKNRLKEKMYNAGIGRISETAVEEFEKQLEKIVDKKVRILADLLKHAKRETVRNEDVKLAFKEF